MSRYTEIQARSRPAAHAMIAGTQAAGVGVYWTPAARAWLDNLGPVETPPECDGCGRDLEPDADDGLCPSCACERIFD